VTPAGGSLNITAPGNWQTEGADIEDGWQDCPPQNIGQTESAQSGNGMVDWADLMDGDIFPCKLDVDATLTFQVAGNVTMKHDDIDVDGC
jgi:hypothetical protein